MSEAKFKGGDHVMVRDDAQDAYFAEVNGQVGTVLEVNEPIGNDGEWGYLVFFWPDTLFLYEDELKGESGEESNLVVDLNASILEDIALAKDEVAEEGLDALAEIDRLSEEAQFLATRNIELAIELHRVNEKYDDLHAEHYLLKADLEDAYVINAKLLEMLGYVF